MPKRKREPESPEEEGGEGSPRKRKPALNLSRLAPKNRKRPPDKRSRNRKERTKGDRKPPGALEKAFTQVLAIIGALIVGVGRTLAAGIKALGPPTQALRRRLAAWVAALSRIVTPVRGLLLAAIGCAALLALSQFVDYRGISIGADAYDATVSNVAPPPEVERAELGSAHSYLMIPVALLAVLALVFAVRTKRWQLCRVAVLLGIVAIVVAIVIDRPAGLDEGNLNRDFTGVEAKLLGGFWMQMFAGAGLAITSFLLAGELKRSGAPAKRRLKSRARKPGKPEPGKAGAAPKAEGAGA